MNLFIIGALLLAAVLAAALDSGNSDGEHAETTWNDRRYFRSIQWYWHLLYFLANHVATLTCYYGRLSGLMRVTAAVQPQVTRRVWYPNVGEVSP